MGVKIKIGAIRQNLIISISIILVLMIFSFYGLYSNHFHFNQLERFLFPIISVIHFIYLYILWFKVSENEYPDTIMRNIEYTMYGVVLFYIFKIIETALLLGTYTKFEGYIIPTTFLPLGIIKISLQILLPVCTIWSFSIRKKKVGNYNFDYLNEHSDH